MTQCIYSGPHFPAFGLNTERYGVRFSPAAGKFGKNADQNNSEYGLFLCSAYKQGLVTEKKISVMKNVMKRTKSINPLNTSVALI